MSDERVTEIRARRVDGEWLSKDDVAEQERRSRKLWDSINDEQRQSILVLVRDSLLRLIEDPEIWVPTSLEPRSGERMDLWISISMSEIDEEVLRRRLETEREISAATTDLVQLKTEFDAEAEAETVDV